MTPARLAAARANAQHSSGPKDTSKTRFNEIKHGCSCEQPVVMPGEDPEEVQNKINLYITELGAETQAEKDSASMAALEFFRPEKPVVANIDATPKTEGGPARDALVRQVTGAVQWERSMRQLAELGVQNFIEVGPGKVLCGLLRQIDRGLTCNNVEDEKSLEKTLNHFTPASPKPE